MTRKVTLFPRIFSACSLFFFPSQMAASGAAPLLIKPEKAEINTVIQKVTPTPVSAAAPTPFICPIYIRSIILYRILINCAKIAGNAILTTRLPIDDDAICSSLVSPAGVPSA